MFKLTTFYIVLAIGILNATSCNNSYEQPLVKTENKLTEISSRDTTINVENSYTELFLDTIKLEDYVKNYNLTTDVADRFTSFYNSRNYQFAWFEPDGLTEQAMAFWNLHENYIHYSKDSSI